MNFLINIYNKSSINYNYFINNFLYKNETKESKLKDIQIIIFLHDFIENDESIEIIDFIYNTHIDSNDIIQINIIHFGINKNELIISKKYINYYFIDNNYLNNNYKYNRAFANNLMIHILNQDNKNEYFYLYFYNIESIIKTNIFNDTNKNNVLNIIENNCIIELSNNNILSNYSSLIINNQIIDNYIIFDPEIFLDYSGYEIVYFLEKNRKYSSILKHSINSVLGNENNIINIRNTLDNIHIYKDFYKTIIDIIDNLNETNSNILHKYLINRYNIINLWDIIDIHIINLDTRKDRYEDTYNELQKIRLYNYSRFPAIYPNIEDIKNSNLINPNKLWKKKNIEYLRSAAGCKMSHLSILKKSLDNAESNSEYIMILEDDVVFCENTEIYLTMALNDLNAMDINWDILYLGTNLKNSDDAIKITDNLLKIKKGLTTTAQVFKRLSLEIIINIIESSDSEIDNTYNDLLEDKYCVYPMCVHQRASYSDINKNMCDYGEFHRKYFY